MRALIHIIDDDPHIRDSIGCLLSSIDLDFVCYANASAFLEAPNTGQPGCILMDLRMPDMSGLELQRLCQKRPQHKPVIFLTGHADVDASVCAMQQGAIEFLTKPVNDELLLQKVREAVALNQEQQIEANRHASIIARIVLLSPRERDVLNGIFDGCSNKRVAQRLGISPKTVELHRANVMRKMHADSLASLVRMCMEVRDAFDFAATDRFAEQAKAS